MDSSLNRTIDTSSPTSEDVSDQLARITASPEFRVPDRGKRLLQYVVTEKLAGREGSLKAYTIAQDVCGRTATFDAQNDPVVRIEAGRLRKELERYYLTDGRDDSVLISIPKGCYVPNFELKVAANVIGVLAPDVPGRAEKTRKLRSILYLVAGVTIGALFFGAFGLAGGETAHSVPSLDTQAAGRMIVDVQPFVGENAGPLPRMLTDAIIGKLFTVNDVIVAVGRTAPYRASTSGENTYSLHGRVGIEGTMLRGVARLVRNTDGAVIWADDFQADTVGKRAFEVEDHLVDGLVKRLATELGKQFASSE